MDRFAAAPAAWYFLGHGHELRKGPVSKDLLGRRLVAYRTEDGRPVLMDARCSHLSADLGRGQVAADRIRCPFHHWEYGPDGDCRRIPGEAKIPEFARQTTYPIVERHGLLFFFNGARPSFPLPFFFDREPEDFVAGRPFQFVGDLAWYMVAANGFDGQHFQTVHNRRLTRPPEVDCPSRFARRIGFRAEVIGNSIYDRLLRRFVGSVVDISITCWGGPMVLVTGFFPNAESYLLISARPLDALRTLTTVIVFARRRRGRPLARLWDPVSLCVRRLFTQGFMKHDTDRLHGIRYNPGTLLASDRLMIEFFEWLTALPGDSEPAGEQHFTPGPHCREEALAEPGVKNGAIGR